jgi:hypothetical protein
MSGLLASLALIGGAIAAMALLGALTVSGFAALDRYRGDRWKDQSPRV